MIIIIILFTYVSSALLTLNKFKVISFYLDSKDENRRLKAKKKLEFLIEALERNYIKNLIRDACKVEICDWKYDPASVVDVYKQILQERLQYPEIYQHKQFVIDIHKNLDLLESKQSIIKGNLSPVHIFLSILNRMYF